MNGIAICFDEVAMDSDLVAALRSRGISVITPLDEELTGSTDEEQLTFSTARGFVLNTFNVSDFYQLHTQWGEEQRPHGGIILARQQRFSVGEQLRRILKLRAALTPEMMQNRVEFLSNWG